MDNAIFVALSRQLAQFRDLEVTANNIANANTNGYRGEKMLFSDYLVPDGNRHKVSYLHDVSTYRDTRNAGVKTTGNPLDLAIRGDGFFAIQTDAGTRYTRNGGFTLNQDGELINADGARVLDVGGQPVVLQPDDKEIMVMSDGAVLADGEERGQVGIFEFDNTQELTHEGDGVMNANNAAPRAAEASTIKQGVIESSNVDAVREVTHLTTLSKSVASTAELIEVMYDLQRKAGRTWLGQNG